MINMYVQLHFKRPEDFHVDVPTYSWKEGEPVTGA